MNQIAVPTKATLNKYGLTAEAWSQMLAQQHGVCGACGKVPTSLRLVTDHEHVRGWKSMRAEDRAKYVRGLLCWTCNHYRLARGATVANLHGAAQYLANYASRKEGTSICAI